LDVIIIYCFKDLAKVEKALEERVVEVVENVCDVVVLGCGSILRVDFSRLKKYGVFIRWKSRKSDKV